MSNDIMDQLNMITALMDTDVDTAKIEKMMRLMEVTKNINQPYNDDELSYTAITYDDRKNTPALNNIKQSIPYLDYKYQKSFLMFIKAMEVASMIEMYEHHINSRNRKSDFTRDMIVNMRSSMPKEKVVQIDKLLRILELKELLG